MVAAVVASAGLCGPLLTGGLSSRVAGMVSGDQVAQRRAEGWDSLSYGLSGTAGPAAVAAIASFASPAVAMLVLGGAAVTAASLTLTLPRSERTLPHGLEPMSVGNTLRQIATSGPLRRVTLATTLPALSLGALSVVAVLLAQAPGKPAWSGADAARRVRRGQHRRVGRGHRLPAPRGAGSPGNPAQCAARLYVRPLRARRSHSIAVAAFALAGASNAAFTAATFSSRSADAPAAARAQVFVSLAAVKVATASLGTAAAGADASLGPRVLLLVGAVVTLVAVAVAATDRHLSGRRRAAA